jgi:hypothetical protein
MLRPWDLIFDVEATEAARRVLRMELKERHVLCQIGQGRVHRLHLARQRPWYLLGERVELGVGEKPLCSSTIAIAVAVLV